MLFGYKVLPQIIFSVPECTPGGSRPPLNPPSETPDVTGGAPAPPGTPCPKALGAILLEWAPKPQKGKAMGTQTTKMSKVL